MTASRSWGWGCSGATRNWSPFVSVDRSYGPCCSGRITETCVNSLVGRADWFVTRSDGHFGSHPGYGAHSPVGQGLHQRRPDDGSIGILQHFAHLFSSRYAKADTGARRSGLSQPGNEGTRGAVDVGARSGDAHRRDRVDEPATVADRLLEAGIA